MAIHVVSASRSEAIHAGFPTHSVYLPPPPNHFLIYYSVRQSISPRHLYQNSGFCDLRQPLLSTLSTATKLAIFQLVAILFGMRLGAFFLAWLCANHLDKAPPIGVLCSLKTGVGSNATHTYQTNNPFEMA